jgi:phosphoglycolate phosphatase-like HAD superfamily hydrolase
LIKAVIFDVDGTLVDSNDLHVEAWREAFRRYGKEVSFEDVHGQMGKGGDQLMPVFCSEEELAEFGEELEQKRVELFKSEYLPRVRPFPRVRELFERVRAEGLQIALASSARGEELERHKKSTGVEDMLEAATSADDAERSKPHPDIFDDRLVRAAGAEDLEDEGGRGRVAADVRRLLRRRLALDRLRRDEGRGRHHHDERRDAPARRGHRLDEAQVQVAAGGRS